MYYFKVKLNQSIGRFIIFTLLTYYLPNNNLMKKGLLLLIFPLFLSSCLFYKPAKVNSPLLQEKYDGDISVNVGTGANINASFSPVNNIVIIGNYNNAYNSTASSENPNTGNQTVYYDYINSQLEAGIGYYNAKLFENFYIDLIAGYGKGQCGTASNINFFFEDLEGYQADYRNHFLQSTFATDLDNPLVFGIGGKVNFLDFYNYQSTDKRSGFPERTYFVIKSKVLFQPFISLRYKTGFIGFESYFGLAFSDKSEYFSFRPLDIGIGLNFDISKFRAQLKDKKTY